MPRKAKITAVPVEQEQQGVFTHMVADQREQKTDAEQMTDIINEVNTAPQSDAPSLNAEEVVVEESLPDGGQIPEDADGAKGPKAKAKPKAQAKRAPSRGPSVRLKHNVIEPEPEPEPEVQAELPVGGQSRRQSGVPRLR